jgi:hypothetical protein
MNPEAVMPHEAMEDMPAACAPDWKDGGLEAAPLGMDLPMREPATERAADPSWKVL